jgi:preprotein translocase subunit YajC
MEFRMLPVPEPLLLSLDAPAAAASGGGFLSSLPLLIAMVAVFYFLVLRPQQKEAAEHQKLVAGLQKGDRGVTTGGVHGKVVEARADTLVLEISDKAQMTVDRDVVKRKVVDPPKDAAAAPAKDAPAPAKGS